VDEDIAVNVARGRGEVRLRHRLTHARCVYCANCCTVGLRVLLIQKSLAQVSGLDLRHFQADRLKEATRAKVHSDIELAVRLEVDSTPTLFLNRRRVSDTRPQAVRVLIDHVLQGVGH